jgi:hypothetical protein
MPDEVPDVTGKLDDAFALWYRMVREGKATCFDVCLLAVMYSKGQVSADELRWALMRLGKAMPPELDCPPPTHRRPRAA